MENIRIFIWKLSVLGGEIFNIFEQACFRNLTNTFQYPDLKTGTTNSLVNF